MSDTTRLGSFPLSLPATPGLLAVFTSRSWAIRLQRSLLFAGLLLSIQSSCSQSILCCQIKTSIDNPLHLALFSFLPWLHQSLDCVLTYLHMAWLYSNEGISLRAIACRLLSSLTNTYFYFLVGDIEMENLLIHFSSSSFGHVNLFLGHHGKKYYLFVNKSWKEQKKKPQIPTCVLRFKGMNRAATAGCLQIPQSFFRLEKDADFHCHLLRLRRSQKTIQAYRTVQSPPITKYYFIDLVCSVFIDFFFEAIGLTSSVEKGKIRSDQINQIT